MDKRETDELVTTRRRRECLKCKKRFTTYERVENIDLVVVKKDGRREGFDRDKLRRGLLRACEKRPVGVDARESLVAKIEKRLQEKGEKEIPSSWIGEEIMSGLKGIDEVAYVRFASVYRQFKDIKEFVEEIRELFNKRDYKKIIPD